MVDVRFKLPRRSVVTLSGEDADSPSPRFAGSAASLRRKLSGAGGPRLGRDTRIAAALVLLAFVPLALATWTFGRAFRGSETDRVDSRLSAATRIAADRTAGAAASALRSARALAASPAVQRALAQGDAGALQRFARTNGDLSLEVRFGPSADVPAQPGKIVRAVTVRGPAASLGTVVAELGPGAILREVGRQTDTELAASVDGTVQGGSLRGWPATGPRGSGMDLHWRGDSFRVLRENVAERLDYVAVLPHDVIDRTVRRRQLLTLGAGALTILALAFAALFVLSRRRARARSGGAGQRSPFSLIGEAVAVAHDPRALLPVILETAVTGTGAVGGRLVSDGEVVATLGSTAAAAESLVLPLDNEDEGRSRLLVLYAPRGGFTEAERELAHSLAAQGRITLENADLHSLVRRQAVTDELTDLANRRRFMEALRQDVARSDRFEAPLSLVLFDLDHFKEINDRCGHQAGDDVLRSAARVIRARVRETDLAARVGGEEFAVLTPGTDLAGAAALAEHLRKDLADQVEVPAEIGSVTASFGVATHRGGDSAEALIGASDRALYRAKAEGRNRVCVEDAEP